MAIKVGEKDLFPYLGDYGPVSIYKGEQKIAGYKWAEKSGQELQFDNTYNSHVHVEVDGKSYQHAGSGKNLHQPEKIIDDNSRISGTSSSLARSRGDRYWYIDYMDIKPNTQYTFSIKTDTEYEDGVFYHVLDKDYEFVLGSGSSSESVGDDYTFTTPLNSKYIRYSFQYGLEDSIQLEEGSTATEYEPPAPTPDYPVEIHSLNDFDVVSSIEKLTEGQLEEYDYGTEYEDVDKINLSLSEPLRSVGDVHDKLFKDSDGFWKVERNVGIINNITGYNSFNISRASTGRPDLIRFVARNPSLGIVPGQRNAISSHVPAHTNSSFSSVTEESVDVHSRNEEIVLFLNSDRASTDAELRNWMSNNNVEIQYIMEPRIETLAQPLQDQLNTLKSFKDSNYIYTVQNTDNLYKEQLKPTLHAKSEVKDI